jgi:isopenicillin-N N-acyltransferase-like protein
MPVLPLVVASGSPHAIGHQYGRAARVAIERNVQAYVDVFAALGASRARVRELGEDVAATTAHHHPRIAAMLEGVAAGAGLPAGEVYALNARTDLLMGLSLGRLDGGCTVLGVDGSRTARGQALLAQNWDWSPAQRDATLVLATQDEDGHAVLALTEAGMLAKAGLNSCGIGLCVNVLASAADGRPGGLPYHVILRAALEARTLDEAAAAVTSAPRSASVHVLLGSADGELVGLELAPGVAARQRPVDGALAHANHFEATAVEDLIPHRPDAADSSRHRARRARARLAQGAATHTQMADILRDHDERPICVHAAPGAQPLEQETLASVLLDPAARRMSVAPGPPCRTDYTPYALAALFS